MAKTHDSPALVPPVVTDFVRDAIREKATRELVALDQRTSAFDASAHARTTLDALGATLAAATPALVACADASTITKLKKLRKAVDEATLLADEIADALEVDAKRPELEASRAEIQCALASVGIDAPALAAAAE